MSPVLFYKVLIKDYYTTLSTVNLHISFWESKSIIFYVK